jgi:hypothetical protein
MVIGTSFFSNDYYTARSRFREAAGRAGATLETLTLDARGPHGEDLSIDIAWFGAAHPERVLLHSSGLHGVEGFAGSAIQLQLLDKLPAITTNGALVLVHILNPYGMAWLRRVNEENVDLNRNSLFGGEEYSGAPQMYGQLDPLLNPPSPPAPDAYLVKVTWTILRYGMPALKQAVAGGQYEFPRGLFFGGKGLQTGLRLYHAFLQRHLAAAKRIVAIDVHTGLGKYGKDTLLVDAAHLNEMREAFGDRVSPLDPVRSVAYRVRGGLQSMIFGLNSEAEVSFIGQEIGTYSPVRIIHVLREENRWHHFGEGGLEHPVKKQLKRSFCPDDETWRSDVLLRGSELLNRAARIVFANDRSIHR